MPHFMLRELLQRPTQQDTGKSPFTPDPISILHFNLVPGGICRDAKQRSDKLNIRFSETVLESVKLLLASPLNGTSREKESKAALSLTDTKKVKIQRLIDSVDSIIQSNEIIAGGIFPYLVAQKSV